MSAYSSCKDSEDNHIKQIQSFPELSTPSRELKSSLFPCGFTTLSNSCGFFNMNITTFLLSHALFYGGTVTGLHSFKDLLNLTWNLMS